MTADHDTAKRMAETGYAAGARFAAELYPQHTRSAVPAILAASDHVAAHKTAVDEIRAYCTTVAAEGTHPQQLIVGDIRRILQHHGLT